MSISVIMSISGAVARSNLTAGQRSGATYDAITNKIYENEGNHRRGKRMKMLKRRRKACAHRCKRK